MKLIKQAGMTTIGVISLTLIAFAGNLISAELFEITDIKFCKKVDEKRRPIDIISEYSEKTANVYAWFTWKNAQPKQPFTAHWYYTSEDIHILYSPITLTRKSDQGVLTLRMAPGKNFPAGSYRLDIEVDGKVIKSASFTVKG